ncbi:hypothetical protein HYPSUDRAFT_202045 [Hypholoma sublateritium FD-334 SS-4]|uniref:Uncharacterized protein n=1 Tax=Hypholoma sublateritium (strain FD-334 SS-4) TaxID=945553 RepID=A0A0D2NUA7_HYPSF|nr:hypothetical protein HYPSUDRAFT_202045 [Hypholoma sublateritium FD-334 SS-4]
MSERPSKRSRTHLGGTYRDTIPLEDDFEVIEARTASLTGPNNTARSSEQIIVNLSWTLGNSWAPEESHEYSLDPDNKSFEEALEADVGDVMANVLLPKTKKGRSQASVDTAAIGLCV